MAIVSLNFAFTGQVGVAPRRLQMVTTDGLSAVTAAGYLTEQAVVPGTIYPTDIIDCIYSYSSANNSGTYGQFLASVGANGAITLSLSTVNPGGNVQAGSNGVAGRFISYPAGVNDGTFSFYASNQGGNYSSGLTTVALNQATTYTMPDPANAAGKVMVVPGNTSIISGDLLRASGTAGVMVDTGFALHGGTTATWGGGGTSNAFTVANMTASWIVVATLLTATNAVSLSKCVPSAGTLTCTFSADPGAGTSVSWIALTAAG